MPCVNFIEDLFRDLRYAGRSVGRNPGFAGLAVVAKTAGGLNRKVKNSLIAGAVVTVITWLLQQFAHVDLPGDVAAAIVAVIMFLVSYQTKA